MMKNKTINRKPTEKEKIKMKKIEKQIDRNIEKNINKYDYPINNNTITRGYQKLIKHGIYSK